MSKVKFIRCKTPADVLVIRDRKEFQRIASGGIPGNLDASCGHAHPVVCGDIWFARPKK